MKEAIDAVTSLNNMFEESDPFALVIKGRTSVITFYGTKVWDSEDDDRLYLNDELESYIAEKADKIIKEALGSLHKAYAKSTEDLQLLYAEACERLGCSLRNIQFWSWPQMFASTAGPRGGIGGHALTTFQVYVFKDTAHGSCVKYCAGVWKECESISPPDNIDYKW